MMQMDTMVLFASIMLILGCLVALYFWARAVEKDQEARGL